MELEVLWRKFYAEKKDIVPITIPPITKEFPSIPNIFKTIEPIIPPKMVAPALSVTLSPKSLFSHLLLLFSLFIQGFDKTYIPSNITFTIAIHIPDTNIAKPNLSEAEPSTLLKIKI